MTIIMRPSLHEYHSHHYLVMSLFLHLLLFSSDVSCFNQHQQQPPISSPEVLPSEEKTRLGSRPPSCHNKCNGCHPCMAVQVPPLPSHNRVQPGLMAEFFDPYPNNNNNGNRYSNYKPLGWKCRCGDHFYNP